MLDRGGLMNWPKKLSRNLEAGLNSFREVVKSESASSASSQVTVISGSQ
jgi:hypothetical protein